ncbi:MAG: type II toxin-antitoxin system RelE/ParE family toxin [Pedosphaera sp.]|nr:type II toxin-antitoxin system RelE/ParE family toxin [Pedosphaera sp.]
MRRKPVRSEAICRVRGRAVKLLAQHPEIGPVWRYGNPNHPTRYLLVPGFHNYLIFYRYEDKEVRLGHLLYGAQDLGDVLGD